MNDLYQRAAESGLPLEEFLALLTACQDCGQPTLDRRCAACAALHHQEQQRQKRGTDDQA